MNTYFAIVHKDPDSSFGISFPDLPGCFSAADTQDELLAQAQLALTLFASDQDEFPQSRSISELLDDPSIKADVANGAFFIAIPLISVRRKARYNLMLDEDLVAGIDRTARAIGMNRSEFVSEAIAAHLGEQAVAVISGKVGDRRYRSNTQAVSKKAVSAGSHIWPRTTNRAEKAAAASVLTKKTRAETTGKKVASAASKILRSKTASKEAKSVAASALTQKVKAKKK